MYSVFSFLVCFLLTFRVSCVFYRFLFFGLVPLLFLTVLTDFGFCLILARPICDDKLLYVDRYFEIGHNQSMFMFYFSVYADFNPTF